MTAASRLGVAAVTFYQRTLSPFVPGGCRFAPTCSEYARLALIEHGALGGAWLALRRLLRCHPWHPGGYDPPPLWRGRP